MQVFTLGQLCQDLNEVVQPPEVAVLSVPFHPGHVVLENLSLRQRGGFPKVNHPDFGLFLLVVNEEEGAPDDLWRGGDQLVVLLLLILSQLRGFQTPHLRLHLQEMMLRFCKSRSKRCVLPAVFAHANWVFRQADLLIQIPALGRRRG